MIYTTGNHKPSAKQIKTVRCNANGSFTGTVQDDFGMPEHRLPIPSGYAFSPGTITALTLKNVEPHTDPWVGHYGKGWRTTDGPYDRRALFWITSLPRYKRVDFQCGNAAVKLSMGDFVIFDDRIMHCVLSTAKWHGVAVQIYDPVLS